MPAGNVPRPPLRAYDRRAARLVGLTAAVAAVGASPAVAAMPDLSAFRLANGATVIHAARPGPSAIEVWVGAGAADEPVVAAGVAHAVEHMVFRARHGGGAPLARAIDRLGGEVNAWTGLDHTVLHAVVPPRALAAGVAAIADALAYPHLAPDALDAERGVLAAEARALAADPDRAAAHALFRQMFLVHPYRRSVVGTPASIAALAASDLAAFFRTWYVGSNTVAVVVADADPAAVVAAARPLAGLARGPVARPPRREPAQLAARIAIERGPTRVALGIRTAGARDPDVDALEIAASALAGRGLHATHHALRDAGALVVTLAGARPVALVDRIAAAIGDLARHLDDAELDRAVATLAAVELRATETAPGLARRLAALAEEAGAAHAPIERLAAALAARVAARADHRRALTADGVRAILAARARPALVSIGALAPGRAQAAPVARALARRLDGARRRKVARAGRPTAPARATSARAAATVVRRELPNGTVVLVRVDPNAPIVAMRALWAGGAAVETASSAGASALLAAAITRGCGARDAEAAAAAVAQIGGVLVGTSGPGTFGLRAEWPARHWRDGLDLLADCALAPRLAAADVAAARHAQLAALATVDGDPARAAFRLFGEALDREHRDPLGTPAAVAAVTAADLVALHEDHYPASRLVLAIVGDVDPELVIAAVRARFADQRAPRRLVPRSALADPGGAAAREVYAYRAGTDTQVVIGFPGPVAAADDRHAVAVLTALLDGPAGAVFGAVRERQGLAYRVGVRVVAGPRTGYLAVHLACAPADADAAVAAVRAAIDAVVAGGASDADVAAARDRLIQAHARAGERRAEVAHGLAYAELLGLGWRAWDQTPALLAAVDAAAVRAAARRYLRWDRAIIATVRPPAQTPGAARRMRGSREAASRSGRGRRR